MSKLESTLAEMVRIDSTNPGLAGGPGEGAFAAHLAARMERLGMETRPVGRACRGGPTWWAGCADSAAVAA